MRRRAHRAPVADDVVARELLGGRERGVGAAVLERGQRDADAPRQVHRGRPRVGDPARGGCAPARFVGKRARGRARRRTRRPRPARARRARRACGSRRRARRRSRHSRNTSRPGSTRWSISRTRPAPPLDGRRRSASPAGRRGLTAARGSSGSCGRSAPGHAGSRTRRQNGSASSCGRIQNCSARIASSTDRRELRRRHARSR